MNDAALTALLDMYYGTREEWHDPMMPPEMDIDTANPAYLDHLERTAAAGAEYTYAGSTYYD